MTADIISPVAVVVHVHVVVRRLRFSLFCSLSLSPTQFVCVYRHFSFFSFHFGGTRARTIWVLLVCGIGEWSRELTQLLLNVDKVDPKPMFYAIFYYLCLVRE